MGNYDRIFTNWNHTWFILSKRMETTNLKFKLKMDHRFLNWKTVIAPWFSSHSVSCLNDLSKSRAIGEIISLQRCSNTASLSSIRTFIWPTTVKDIFCHDINIAHWILLVYIMQSDWTLFDTETYTYIDIITCIFRYRHRFSDNVKVFVELSIHARECLKCA